MLAIAASSRIELELVATMPSHLFATTTFLAAGALLVPRAPPVRMRIMATPTPPAASISPPPPPPADVWNDDIKERWSVAYSSLREEGDYEITEVEGTIPASLRVTVYLSLIHI